MPEKIAIVSAADEGYFHFLQGLITSLDDAKLPNHFHRCVYDVGLTAQQAELLRSRNVSVLKPRLTIESPHRALEPSWFGAMTNRPSLPRNFPGYETYIWIDADAWVQQPEGIYAAVENARDGSIAIVTERFERAMDVPRFDGHFFRKNRVDESTARITLAKCYRDCFGEENEYRATQACFNTGFFALRWDSPVWDQWLQYLRRGLTRGIHYLVEQQALTLGILEGEIAATTLSARYNWTPATMEPLYDTTTGILIDRTERKPLGLVHIRELKHLHFIDVPDLDGQMVQLNLRYPKFIAQRNEFERGNHRTIGI